MPHLINHCKAQGLQLVAEKAANKVPYLTKRIDINKFFAKKLKLQWNLQTQHFVETP